MCVCTKQEDGSSGTFVMSSEDDIKTSLNDWIRGKNGFEYRHSWISPGMQSINNHWEGQETPAQERIEDPITQQISGQKVKMMRRKSLEVVKSCRQQQGQQGMAATATTRRRSSLSFTNIRDYWKNKKKCNETEDNNRQTHSKSNAGFDNLLDLMKTSNMMAESNSCSTNSNRRHQGNLSWFELKKNDWTPRMA